MGSRNWERLGWIELEWCVRLGCWNHSVSSGGYEQRRQHQHPSGNDQSGVLGKRREVLDAVRGYSYLSNLSKISTNLQYNKCYQLS